MKFALKVQSIREMPTFETEIRKNGSDACKALQGANAVKKVPKFGVRGGVRPILAVSARCG